MKHLYIISLGLVIGLFLLVAFFTWGQWLPTYIFNHDFGREVLAPLRILSGETIYEDFNFVYPPLAPCLNAFLLYVSPFSPIQTLRIIALILCFTIGVVLELVAKRFLDVKGRFAVQLVYIAGFLVPGLLGGNFLTPYSFNFLYAVFFCMLTFYFSLKAFEKKVSYYFVIPVVTFLLSVLSKLDFVASGFGVVIASLILAKNGDPAKYYRNWVVALLSGTIFLGLAISVMFVVGISPPQLLDGLLQAEFRKQILQAPLSIFHGRYFLGGTVSLYLIFGALIFSVYSFYFVFVYLTNKKTVFYSLLSLGIILVILSLKLNLFFRTFKYFIDVSFFLGSVFALWWFPRLHRSADKDKKIILLVGALGLWARPFLHLGIIAVPHGYSLLPLILIVAYWWWSDIAPLLANKTANYLIKKEDFDFYRAKGIALMLFLSFSFISVFNIWSDYWSKEKVSFRSPFGTILVNKESDRFEVWMDTVDFLRSNLKRNDKFITITAEDIDVALGQMPILPISQLHFQIDEDMQERIVGILECNKTIKYIVFPILVGECFYFGPQYPILSDYIDDKWRVGRCFNVPKGVDWLTLGYERRKYHLKKDGVIIFERKGKSN